MIRAENNNYLVSLERVGDIALLVERFTEATEALFQLLRKTADPPEHFHSISVLVLSTAYDLEKACLECLRGRLTEAAQITRRPIEAAAFAARIDAHPEFAEVWFRASPRDESYEKYRKKFSPGKLFPKDDDLLQRLWHRWDHASRLVHTSVASIARRASIKIVPGGLEFEFKQFEVDAEDPSEPARTLLWILDTHLVIMRVFERIFRPQLGDFAATWKSQLHALDVALSKRKEVWRDRIVPPSAAADDEEPNST